MRRSRVRQGRAGGGACSLADEPVAHTGLGDDEARLGRIGLDLSPQTRHIDAQIVRLGFKVRPPTALST